MIEYIIKEDNGYNYVEIGEGAPLILLHGLFGALSNWQAVIENFSKSYKVVVPLLPIYDLPILNTNVSALAKFLHGFLTFKKFSDVILLGNSLGGHVALVYTLEHPEFVKGLVLTGSSGLYENSFGGSFPKRESYDYVQERVGYTFYNPHTATKELVDEVYATVNDRNKVMRILAMAKSAIRHNMRKELSKISQPTCLIWGKQDTITPPEVAEDFRTLIPKSELHWIEQCGHAPMMEHSAQFNVILTDFLNRVLA